MQHAAETRMCMQALPLTLVHLSVRGNVLSSLQGIECLLNLRWLDASCNRIQVRRDRLVSPDSRL